ncbi:coiled-coil domain-containing protein 12-like [Argonauta hians]
MADVGELQQAALKRKARLEELKAKRLCKKDSNEKTDDIEAGENLPKPLFRSYQPLDESLLENQLPKAKPGKVEENIQEQLDAANVKTSVEDVDLFNLAPRKPDWDLKRDISKKLSKLERRTQRAIALLIRDRLKGNNQDLVTAMNATDTLAKGDDDDADND